MRSRTNVRYMKVGLTVDTRFLKTEMLIRALAPGFKVVPKENSRLMRLLSKVLFFNDSFDQYTTTIGKTVYMPAKDIGVEWVTLAHEGRHVLDRQKWGVLFGLSYLFPQILAVFALLAPLSWWWLLSLVFLLPLPAPFRSWWEKRGYGVNFAILYWLGADPTIETRLHQWVGWAYYKMWPFPKGVRRWHAAWMNQVRADEVDEYLLKLRALVKENRSA